MAEKLPAKVEEQVKEVVRRKRPGKSADMSIQVEPGDNAKFTMHQLMIRKLQKIDIDSAEQIESRTDEYLTLCVQNDMKPSIASYALALGISRDYLWEIRTGRTSKTQAVMDTIKKGCDFITSLMEDYMQNGKINPVAGIFLMKNNMGYQDKQEVVLTPNAPLGEETTPAELQEKYIEVVGEAESEQK